MIGSTGLGKGFGGLARYLLHGHNGMEPDRAAWTATRNLAIQDPELAPRVMRATAEQNTRVKKPVYHLSLSASPGESLSRDQWEAAADRVLKNLGLSEHQALIVVHHDTAHEHVHVMVNRVHPEHLKVWKNSHDFPKIERALRELEREWGLREVPGRNYQLDSQERRRRSNGPTQGERHQADRTGTEPWVERVRFQVLGDFKRARSWADLEHRLQKKGLHLRRRGQGLVVTDGTCLVKASRIHRAASYCRLGERFGMSFEEWRSARTELLQRAAEFERHERLRDTLKDRRTRFIREVGPLRELEDRPRVLRDASHAEIDRLWKTTPHVFQPEDLEQALRRIQDMARHQGWMSVAEAMRHDPERFGRLHGVDLVAWKSESRQHALRAAETVARRADRAGSLQKHAGRLREEVARNAPRAAMAEARLTKVNALLDMLPERRPQERALAKLALRIGVPAAKLVLPTPIALPVVGAMRLARQMASRDRDLGMGR